MENTVATYRKLVNRRIVITRVIMGFIILSGIIYFMKLPVHMADWFVPFEIAEPYIPFKVENSYSKIIGFDRVKLVYENENESITLWATTEIGWNNVSSWETVQLRGATGYYNETSDIQMISFKVDSVEYAIDYRGKEFMSKEELIKIANSIVISKYAGISPNGLVLFC